MTTDAQSDLSRQTDRETGGAADAEGNVIFETLLAFTLQHHPDDDSALSAVLGETGIEHHVFDHSAALIERVAELKPDIVFLDVDLDSTQAVDTLFALSQARYPGIVQLISGAIGQADIIRHTGQRLGLLMLPVLSRPFSENHIATMLVSEGLRAGDIGLPTLDLSRALQNGWVEFWHQPKINLRKNQIAGVEVLARARQPNRGVLSPWSFLGHADEKSMTRLSEEALISALKTSGDVARIGVKLRLAVNLSFKALRTLPLPNIVRTHRPKIDNWPGLLLDVSEKDVAANFLEVHDLKQNLAQFGIKLAVDDYGHGQLTAAQLRTLDCAELKLDRSFVTGCTNDPTKIEICQRMVQLAHAVGSIAVAVGIERAAEAAALQNMGCDVGQGFLFGQPMPQDRFLGLLLERAGRTQSVGQPLVA